MFRILLVCTLAWLSSRCLSARRLAPGVTPGENGKGKCCYKSLKRAKIYRWFYWEEHGNVKKTSELVGDQKHCPHNWHPTGDLGFCREEGVAVYNQHGYKEDADWVLCCTERAGDVQQYEYFLGDDCSKQEPDSCTSYDCDEHDGVDEADYGCEVSPGAAPKQKLVNLDATKYCEKSTLGMSDIDCAGYPKRCKNTLCYAYSFIEGDFDCRDRCPLWNPAKEKHPERVVDPNKDTGTPAPMPDDGKGGGGAQISTLVKFVIIPIVIVVLLLTGCAATYWCARPKKDRQQQSKQSKPAAIEAELAAALHFGQSPMPATAGAPPNDGQPHGNFGQPHGAQNAGYPQNAQAWQHPPNYSQGRDPAWNAGCGQAGQRSHASQPGQNYYAHNQWGGGGQATPPWNYGGGQPGSPAPHFPNSLGSGDQPQPWGYASFNVR